MPKKILLIDNYDSFTYNLYDYFLQLKTDCTVIRNDELSFDAILQLDFDAIVFSPGPKTPSDAGLLMPLVAHYFEKKPMLGICLGHQAIGIHAGAVLTKAQLPMHGKTSTIQHQGHPLFKNLAPSFDVMRYHSLIIENIEETPLNILAQTADGEIMALAHQSLPVYGLQFHPESILTEHGLELLQNWLDLIESGSDY